ncbi:MAG: BamA/TamA family outer membrane protein, partial [Bdellovibrionales bacterium]|nr:BamA/TamA family outer membrane protein [Bdellovibrionales bacterium]
KQQIGLIGPILDIDHRDNSFLPTRGYYNRYSLEYAAPALGSSQLIEFARLESIYSHYLPLISKKVVSASSISGGYVKNLRYKTNSGVPLRYAFFLGGSSTIRGFESTSRDERIPSNDEFEAEDPIGLVVENYSTYYLFKSEMRWDIYKEWGAVGFYDGGSVHVGGKEFKKPYRQSIGVGLRYNTPVGPIRLDLGWKLDRKKTEEKSEKQYRIHFAIGTF